MFFNTPCQFALDLHVAQQHEIDTVSRPRNNFHGLTTGLDEELPNVSGVVMLNGAVLLTLHVKRWDRVVQLVDGLSNDQIIKSQKLLPCSSVLAIFLLDVR